MIRQRHYRIDKRMKCRVTRYMDRVYRTCLLFQMLALVSCFEYSLTNEYHDSIGPGPYLKDYLVEVKGGLIQELWYTRYDLNDEVENLVDFTGSELSEVIFTRPGENPKKKAEILLDYRLVNHPWTYWNAIFVYSPSLLGAPFAIDIARLNASVVLYNSSSQPTFVQDYEVSVQRSKGLFWKGGCKSCTATGCSRCIPNMLFATSKEFVQRLNDDLKSWSTENRTGNGLQEVNTVAGIDRQLVEFNANPKDVIVERVAVVAAQGMDCGGVLRPGQDLASYVEGSLLGYYEVVERRNLERVLDEQKLALSGIMFEKSTVEAGCNIGAQGIIFTEFGCIGGEETIQVKLVDCQTSELYWSATGHGSSILDVVKEIKANLDE